VASVVALTWHWTVPSYWLEIHARS